MTDTAIRNGERTTPPGPSTDAALLSLYRRGQNDAATELYLRYAGRLRSLAKARTSAALAPRLDTEDIVQSVFRTFFRRAAKGEYTVPDGEELWKLFLVIGLNKIRAAGVHHRAAKRDVRRTTTGEAFHEALDLAGADDAVALDLLRLTIDELLAPWPETYRDVVRLRIEGHEVAEIAAQTKRAKRSVERILQEFRQALQGQIHDRD